MASKTDPDYSAVIVSKDGPRYDITDLMESVEMAEDEGQIAQRATVSFYNAPYNELRMNQLVRVGDRMFVYANDGEGPKEVFRGFVWEIEYSSELEKILSVTAYDNLIYFQESEDSLYYSSGMETSAVTSNICYKWGVKQNYTYESITHGKLTLEGTLSDIFLNDLLGEVEKQKGIKFVIRSREDIIDIAPYGQNETVYELHQTDTVLNTLRRTTMEGVITKIKIVSASSDDGASNTEAVVEGNTSKYGTLQKIVQKDTDKSLSDAQSEAQTQIDENSEPEVKFTVDVIDIPWVRKGDKVYIAAGDMRGNFFIVGVSRKIKSDEKIMTLTCIFAE